MSRLGMVIAGAVALVASVVTPAPHATAQQRTLTVAAYAGSVEKAFRKDVIAPFAAKHGVKIDYVAGASTETMARLISQKAGPIIDLAVLDDGPMQQAVQLGLCAPYKAAAVFDDIYPVMRYPGGKAVGVGVVATGLFYNTKVFKENGWPAPTSWADLADKKWGKRVLISSIGSTYGLHALIMAAKINGGGEKAIEPGFKAMIRDIGPQVAAFEVSSGKFAELIQQELGVVGVWGSGRVKAVADTGFPVAFVYPKEGGVALGVASCVVAGSKNDDLAQLFLQHLLSPDVQRALALAAGYGPANSKVMLSAKEREGLPYGDQVKGLQAVDWATVNAARAEWTKRWTREVER